MDKLSTNMMKTVQEMLKNSKEVSITSIPPISSDKEFLKFLTELKVLLSKNKSKTVNIIVSVG